LFFSECLKEKPVRPIKIEKILLAPAIHAMESTEIRTGIYECTGATDRWEIMPGSNEEAGLVTGL
jgi:hypothetical protein